MKTNLLKPILSVAAVVVIASACMQSSPHLLVKIDQRDSISVREFQSVLAEMGAGDLSYEEKRKIALNLINDRLKALSAIDEKIDQQEDVQKILQQYRNEILREEARNRYIFPHFINDSTVDFYMNHTGVEVEAKNFVYRYKDNPRSKITRTRDEAKKFVDSIYSIMNKDNYDTLTFQFSEYVDRQTGRGNYRPDRLKFGTLPYSYEMTVFRSEVKTLHEPVEIQGAFLIPWVVKFSTDSSAQKPKNREEATKQFRKKVESVDGGLLLEFYRNYSDSLLASGKVNIVESSIDTFLRVVPSEKSIESILETLDERYHNLVMVEFPGLESITLKSLLGLYDAKNILPKLTKENLTDILQDQMRDRIFTNKPVQDGYTGSEEFRIAYNKRKNGLLIQRIQSIKIIKPDSVPVETARRYYEIHKDQFIIPATVKIQEIYSKTENDLKEVSALYRSGLSIGQSVDSVRHQHAGKKHYPLLKQPVLLTQQDDELARMAFKYNVDEMTPVIPRKDGGFSVLRILEKKESQKQAFETVRNKAESMVVNEEVKKQEIRWLNGMKEKLRVVFYENNLK